MHKFKNKIALIGLIITSPLFAAEEGSRWSCEGVNAIGFYWQEGSWQNQAFAPSNYLFSVGSQGNGSLIFSGYQWSFSNCITSNILRCSTDVGNSFVMNLDTGAGAVSSIVAAALPPEEEEASTFMERIQCLRVES